MANEPTNSDDEKATDDNHEYTRRRGGDWVDQRFIEEGRYDY